MNPLPEKIAPPEIWRSPGRTLDGFCRWTFPKADSIVSHARKITSFRSFLPDIVRGRREKSRVSLVYGLASRGFNRVDLWRAHAIKNANRSLKIFLRFLGLLAINLRISWKGEAYLRIAVSAKICSYSRELRRYVTCANSIIIFVKHRNV